MLRSSLLFLAIGMALSALAAAPVTPGYIKKAVADPARPPGQMARDTHRKPEALIAFAGLKPGDKIIDFSPGTGYWTRIFSKIVGPKGHVYAYVVNEKWSQPAPRPDNADPPGPLPPDALVAPILAIQHTRGYENVLAIEPTPRYMDSIAVPEQVDMVWTANNYHDLHTAYAGSLDMVTINKAIYRDLKPGGIYMVIDHATAPGAGFTQATSLHRSDKEAVKAEVLQAGFTFVAESDILANAFDNHLAPSSELHDVTDQYILKFMKPKNAPAVDKRPAPDVMRLMFGNTFVLGTPSQRFRSIFYHPDGTVEDIGIDDMKPGATSMQSGFWFWDADGNSCVMHQYPSQSEGSLICHPWTAAHTNAKLNVPFTEYYFGGQEVIVTVVKGYQYPNVTSWPKTID